MPTPEEMSHDELITLVAERDAQLVAMAGQLSELIAWYLLDPLAAQFYFVRRHDDGWKLLKVLARISGDGFATEREAREWAEQAVRTRTDQRVFDWSPAAGTDLPGYTLIGTAG